MRMFLALILLALSAAAPAAAQSTSPRIMELLRRNFPAEHNALSAKLAGQPLASARLILGEGLEKFHQDHLDSILAAPGAGLIAIEARHGAMLRSLQARDVKLCAAVGDRGFFSSAARAGAPADGLEDYAVALIEAAAAGRGRSAPQAATAEDFTVWLAEIERRNPNVPVRAMLLDRELRLKSSDEHLCVGAALMHEATSSLPPDQAARLAAVLVRSVLAASMPNR